jgi:hypothetical protein
MNIKYQVLGLLLIILAILCSVYVFADRIPKGIQTEEQYPYTDNNRTNQDKPKTVDWVTAGAITPRMS